jgi:hypothetical protein
MEIKLEENEIDYNELKNFYKVRQRFSDIHKCLIFNSSTMNITQYDYEERSAIRSCDILNDHEIRNGRDPVYRYIMMNDVLKEVLYKLGVNK